MADEGPAPFEAFLGPLGDAVRARLAALAGTDFVARLWRRDPTLWKADERHQEVASRRLGWLGSVGVMQASAEDLAAFAREAAGGGFRTAFLLGMGGSSLCPEVFARIFGRAESALDLVVLDTTDPAAIRAAERRHDLRSALFLASSKSGTTVETLSLHAHFSDRLRAAGVARPGRHFVAITDPGSPLAELAAAEGFQRTFLNPPDIGGRYSALSFFGLVPAALLGMGLPKLLDRASRMASACGPAQYPARNAGVRLGAILGEAALAGRDKATFILSPRIASFGWWVEQLLAESTGKDGRGILPVEGEPPGPSGVYGGDRIFIYLRLRGAANAATDAAAAAVREAGQPVVRLDLEDFYDLGGEFLRWEVATAAAGAVLEVDPFDEPNVKESKDNTERLLGVLAAEGRLPEGEPFLRDGPIALHAPASRAEALRREAEGRGWTPNAAGILAAHLAAARPGDYLALMAYVARDEAHEGPLQGIRQAVRDRLRIAATLGYGPRFLHSTGQYHKGGPDKGVFLQVTAEDAEDAAVPGKPYTFAALKKAQALGDLEALVRRERRALRVHLSGETASALQALERAIRDAAGRLPPGPA
jgi:glucose-6-phosphate isomerase